MSEASQQPPEDAPEPEDAVSDGEETTDEGAPAEEPIPVTGFIGFVLVPLVIVLSIVGILWLGWYLTYDRKTVADYARELRSEDRTVRWQAALGLIETNQADESLLPVLEDMLATSDEDQSLQGVVWTTRDMLKTPEERKVNLRWYAAAALGKIGGERATLRLIELLKDPEDGVRFYSAHGLGRVRDPRAVPPLVEMLESDPDGGARAAAVWALGEIGAASEDAEAREAVARAHGADAETDVRWNAALALARFGDRDAIPTLREMMNSDNPNTRDQARRSLGRLERASN